MARNVWILAELNLLRADYLMCSHEDIGRKLGRSRNAVRTKAWELGLRKKSANYSQEELEIIRELYEQQVGLEVVALTLRRPATEICHQARKMGLTDYHRPSSDKELALRSVLTRERIRKYGHPHGRRVIITCPECGKFFDQKKSQGQKYCSHRCSSKANMKGRTVFSRGVVGRRDDLRGQYFRSRYEANYARYLNFIIEHGEPIASWEYEATTFEFKRIKRGVRFYTPDFRIVYLDGRIEYHEVKGWDYPRGKTARARMKRYYPKIRLAVIGPEFFKAARKQGIDRLIPGWEKDGPRPESIPACDAKITGTAQEG